MAEIPLGLLGFAAGAMGAGSASPHPMGFGQALSGGLLSGLNNYAQLQGVQNQNSQNQMRQMALMQQMKAQSQAQQQEAAKQQALEQYVSGLPEDQQALARAAPDAVVKGVVERQFRAPEPPKSRSRAVGGVEVFEEWNPQALKWEQVSEAPRWNPLQGPLSATTIHMPDAPPHVGTIPPGWQLVRTQEGGWQMAPIAGGPVDVEQQEAAAKAEGLQTTKNVARGTVVQDAGRALEMITQQPDLVAGPVAAASRYLPGTPAYVMQGHIDSIGSNIGLDVLQTMRENSPTGGALGQVPIQQQQRLEAVYGNLALGQPPDVIADNLKRIDNIYTDLIHGTPAEIQKMVSEGQISADEAAPLMRRHELSFDERGRPISAAPSGPPDPATASVEDILEYWSTR